MNYRDFYKNNNSNWKKYLHLLPEGVDPKEFEMGFKDEFGEHPQAGPVGAAKIASQHLSQNPKYYTKLNKAGLEEKELIKGMKLDDGCCDDGLPKRPDGSLDIEHDGRPIHLSKIVQIGAGFGQGMADGEVSGYTAVDKGGVEASVEGDKEPITAGGKTVKPGIASKSVGDKVVPGAGQKQGGPNTKGCIAGTKKMGGESSETGEMTLNLQEAKTKLREMVKDVLKEIQFNKETGRWERLDEGGHKKGCTCGFCKNKGTFGKKKKDDDKKEKEEVDDSKEQKKKDKSKTKDKRNGRTKTNENVDMKMGPSYKVANPQYRTADDDQARTVQFEPEITEMYDEEEEACMMERYTELATAKRNLSEVELSELKNLSEKIEKVDVAKRNFGASQGGTEPNVYESDVIKFKKGQVPPPPKPIMPPPVEEKVDMKMGPSYKADVQTYRCADCDPARTSQYDPQMSEAGGAAVQHKSLRVANDNPQIVKNRHKGDID